MKLKCVKRKGHWGITFHFYVCVCIDVYFRVFYIGRLMVIMMLFRNWNNFTINSHLLSHCALLSLLLVPLCYSHAFHNSKFDSFHSQFYLHSPFSHSLRVCIERYVEKLTFSDLFQTKHYFSLYFCYQLNILFAIILTATIIRTLNCSSSIKTRDLFRFGSPEKKWENIKYEYAEFGKISSIVEFKLLFNNNFQI